jgi:hypothetical protein
MAGERHGRGMLCVNRPLDRAATGTGPYSYLHFRTNSTYENPSEGTRIPGTVQNAMVRLCVTKALVRRLSLETATPTMF